MELAIKIAHKNYRKITDDLMWLSSKWMLKFTTLLTKKTEKHGEQNYHKEYGYYKGGDYCVNINRSFDYFLSIESIDKNSISNMKDSINIRQTDMYALKFKLNQVAEWFTAEHNQGLFAKKDGKIFMPRGVNPIRLSGLAFNGYMEFEPVVCNYDNGEQSIGVRVYINSETNGFYMEISKFLGFKDFIENFNMYQSAQLMLNYLQRPEYGEYLYDMESKSNNGPKYNNGGGKFLS